MRDATAVALDPVALWNAVFRRRRLAAGVFSAAAVGAAALALFLPDLYVATATVLVERSGVAESLAKTPGAGDPEMRLQTISQQILSRTRLQDLIERLDLYPAMRAAQAPPEAVIERMRRDLRLDLKGADTGGRTTTIAFTVSYRGLDPRTVTLVANTLASSYVEENTRVRERQASGATGFLKVQLEEAKARLDAEEQRIGEFKRLHGGELPEQVDANLATLERLNAQLHLNSEMQGRALARRDALALRLGESDPGEAGGEAALRRLVALREKLAELRTSYLDRHPEVARVLAEIAALEAPVPEAPEGSSGAAPDPPAVARLRRDLERVDAEIATLRSQAAALRGSIARHEASVGIAPQREQDLRKLSRDYDATRELYLSLLRRYDEAEINERLERGREGEQYRVLDPAVVPTVPAAPNRLHVLIAGLAVAAAAAAGAIVAAERWDSSFHSGSELTAFTAVPLLAVIPRFDAPRAARWGRRGLVVGAGAVGLAAIVAAAYVVAHGSEGLTLVLGGGS